MGGIVNGQIDKAEFLAATTRRPGVRIGLADDMGGRWVVLDAIGTHVENHDPVAWGASETAVPGEESLVYAINDHVSQSVISRVDRSQETSSHEGVAAYHIVGSGPYTPSRLVKLIDKDANISRFRNEKAIVGAIQGRLGRSPDAVSRRSLVGDASAGRGVAPGIVGHQDITGRLTRLLSKDDARTQKDERQSDNDTSYEHKQPPEVSYLDSSALPSDDTILAGRDPTRKKEP